MKVHDKSSCQTSGIPTAFWLFQMMQGWLKFIGRGIDRSQMYFICMLIYFKRSTEQLDNFKDSLLCLKYI